MKPTNQTRQLHHESQLDMLVNLPARIGIQTSESLTDACQYTRLYADSLGAKLAVRTNFSDWAELHEVEKIYTRMTLMNLTLTLAVADRVSGVFAARSAGGPDTPERKLCNAWKDAVDETTEQIEEASSQIQGFARDQWILRPAIPDGNSRLLAIGSIAFGAFFLGEVFEIAPLAGFFPTVGLVAVPMVVLGAYGHMLLHRAISMRGAHDRKRAGGAVYSSAMNAYLDVFDQTGALDPFPQSLAIVPPKLTLEGQCLAGDIRQRARQRQRMQKLHK